MKIKIMTVVGARPNFMKAAPLITAINEHNRRVAPKGPGPVRHTLVHTGQHYDKEMSGLFFRDLGLPRPDVSLGAGGGTHARQTAEIMSRFEPVLMREQPDFVLLVGDVNSTVSCALVASKASYNGACRPVIAHIEAGLRSFDRAMPEEVNRVLTDHLSDLLFVTEESGIRNLRREGIEADKIHFVGNTMIDTLLKFKRRADSSRSLSDLRLRGQGGRPREYALLTLHRPANVDDRKKLKEIVEALSPLSSTMPVVFPAHPRTRTRIEEFGLIDAFSFASPAERGAARGKINLIAPQGYIDFLSLMKNARIVLTDSGGIQEETTCLGVPCVTIRENTERPVTVRKGTNILAGVEKEGIAKAIATQLKRSVVRKAPDKWDGRSAKRILRILIDHGRSRFRF